MHKTNFILMIPLVLALTSHAQVMSIPPSPVSVQKDSIQLSQRRIDLVEVKNADLKDVLRGLAAKYNLNIVIDDAIQQRVTLRLVDIPLTDALSYIVSEHGLNMSITGSIYRITLPEIVKPIPPPLKISYQDGLLSVELKDEDIDRVIPKIVEATKRSIMIGQGVEGKVTGYLQNSPFDQGFSALMSSNGFMIRRKNEIYLIDNDPSSSRNELRRNGRSYQIEVKDGLATVEVVEAELSPLIRELSNQFGASMVLTSALTGKVNVQCAAVPFDEVLNYVFRGTNYTFRKEGNVYFIGDKKERSLSTTRLIRLNYIKAEDVEKMIAKSLTESLKLQIIEEHNGIMVTGPQDAVREVEDFVKQIDYPIPQILIEAIVVDFNSTDIGQFGVTAGMKSGTDTTMSLDAGTFFPAVNITASGGFLNDGIEIHGPKIGLKNIGKLPENFYMSLKALETKGKANIRSRPQIATLNGKKASIKIGTTQYYQLESYQPIVGGNTAFTQTSQRFEQIKAEISLEITPWVSASGEITTIIKPEFSTPRRFDSKTPPTIDYRTLESTVRLRDGETIILGGMTKDTDEESVSKLPILGDIPILGRLFQDRSHNKSKATLMIYITPHLMYGDNPAFQYQGTTP